MSGNKRFGHVGDPEVASIDPAMIPRFDQAHVDYLKKVFDIGGACPIIAKSVDDAVAVVAWVNQDQGNREVIAHIENIISQQKGAL